MDCQLKMMIHEIQFNKEWIGFPLNFDISFLRFAFWHSNLAIHSNLQMNKWAFICYRYSATEKAELHDLTVNNNKLR